MTRAELERQVQLLSLEPGTVLQLLDGSCHDPDPWTFVLLEVFLESERALLLRLPDDRGEHGTTTLEDLSDMLDDLTSSSPGIRWCKL